MRVVLRGPPRRRGDGDGGRATSRAVAGGRPRAGQGVHLRGPGVRPGSWVLGVSLAAGLALGPAGCGRAPTAGAGGPDRAGAALEALTAGLGMRAAAGRDLFLNYCARCHGAEGKADGINSRNLDPEPKDLAQVAGNTEYVRQVIERGSSSVGLSPLCPAWGETLSAEAIDSIVLYVGHLGREPEAAEAAGRSPGSLPGGGEKAGGDAPPAAEEGGGSR